MLQYSDDWLTTNSSIFVLYRGRMYVKEQRDSINQMKILLLLRVE